MYLYGLIIALIFLFITLKLIKKRSLNLGVSLLWIFVSLIFIILSVNRYIIEILAEYFDVFYPPSLIFMLGILASFSLILSLIVKISKLHRQVVSLTQEVGILKSQKNE